MTKTASAMLSLAFAGLAHAATPDTPASSDRECAPFNIAVVGPKGTSFRLVYLPGKGWAFADRYIPLLASADPKAGTADALQVDQTETPQSVFVDGPSGYVFVYVIDEGWRFVGAVANAKR
jgi:hypothetical protein